MDFPDEVPLMLHIIHCEPLSPSVGESIVDSPSIHSSSQARRRPYERKALSDVILAPGRPREGSSPLSSQLVLVSFFKDVSVLERNFEFPSQQVLQSLSQLEEFQPIQTVEDGSHDPYTKDLVTLLTSDNVSSMASLPLGAYAKWHGHIHDAAGNIDILGSHLGYSSRLWQVKSIKGVSPSSQSDVQYLFLRCTMPGRPHRQAYMGRHALQICCKKDKAGIEL
jgi:hypothetical protein